MASPIPCKNCGVHFMNANYCPNCGKKVHEDDDALTGCLWFMVGSLIIFGFIWLLSPFITYKSYKSYKEGGEKVFLWSILGILTGSLLGLLSYKGYLDNGEGGFPLVDTDFFLIAMLCNGLAVLGSAVILFFHLGNLKKD